MKVVIDTNILVSAAMRDGIPEIEVKIEVGFPRDRKDAKFLACAIAANADFLITGDRDFEDVQTLKNTTILSAKNFKQLFFD